LHDAPEHGRIRVEATAPEPIGDNRDLRRARVVDRREESASLRANSEQVEIASIDRVERDVHSDAIDIHRRASRREHRKRNWRRREGVEFGARQTLIRPLCAKITLENDELLWRVYRNTRQEQGVNETENRGVGADAE